MHKKRKLVYEATMDQGRKIYYWKVEKKNLFCKKKVLKRLKIYFRPENSTKVCIIDELDEDSSAPSFSVLLSTSPPEKI